MEDTRDYLCVQVEKDNADEIWLAIKGMTGVVSVVEMEQD